ncbi:hypothetical protein [Brevundimonas bacteroides]|uniref:hypothetical protein n=1 Tax=Brevundimonas bacteroides TaxID=74311 RepID=UPI00068CB376|nr:hypothetical protein [Brevundimonas bacteroides]
MTDTPTPAAPPERLLPILRLIGWGCVAVLLITPAVAMRFNPEVQWTAFDFLLAGAILIGAGLVCEVVVRASRDWGYRLGVLVTLATSILLFWINGAVGVIGSENNPQNLWFGLVLATVLFGSILVRFRAGGMSLVLTAAAAVQFGIGTWAWVADWGEGTEKWPVVILVTTAAFTAAWLVAAALFRGARRQR